MVATDPHGGEGAAESSSASTDSVASDGAGVSELEQIALFSSLNDDMLRILADRLVVRVVAADEVLFKEGDAGRAMYVVLEGAVALFKRDRHLVTANAGDWFGEMCLIDVMARPVTARATTASKLLKISPPDLRAVYCADLKMYALLMMNLARQLSRKLRIALGDDDGRTLGEKTDAD